MRRYFLFANSFSITNITESIRVLTNSHRSRIGNGCLNIGRKTDHQLRVYTDIGRWNRIGAFSILLEKIFVSRSKASSAERGAGKEEEVQAKLYLSPPPLPSPNLLRHSIMITHITHRHPKLEDILFFFSPSPIRSIHVQSSLPVPSQLHGTQTPCELRKWPSKHRSQWSPAVLFRQLTQRPPFPVRLNSSSSNSHLSAWPLQRHSGKWKKKKKSSFWWDEKKSKI